MKIWQKNNHAVLNPEIERFCSGDDLVLDIRFKEFEVKNNLAHLEVLVNQGIINKKEKKQAEEIFQEILKDQNFKINFGSEDIHGAVEDYLRIHSPVLADKIHYGRSRNDLSSSNVVQYCIFEAGKIMQDLEEFIELVYTLAKKYQDIPFPGFTHTQVAMPVTVGFWLASYLENFIDSYNDINNFLKANNRCVLGAAAGFGTPTDIDRNTYKDFLNQTELVVNTNFAITWRNKIQIKFLSELASLAWVFSGLAEDMILYNSNPFGLVSFDNSISNGSSIMPQKKNLEVFETTRAKANQIFANSNTVTQITSAKPSGYNTDNNHTKKYLIESVDTIKQIIGVNILALEKLIINQTKIADFFDESILATNIAYQKTKEGAGFRTAYKETGEYFNNYKPQKVQISKIKEAITENKILGGPGNLGLEQIINKLTKAGK